MTCYLKFILIKSIIIMSRLATWLQILISTCNILSQLRVRAGSFIWELGEYLWPPYSTSVPRLSEGKKLRTKCKVLVIKHEAKFTHVRFAPRQLPRAWEVPRGESHARERCLGANLTRERFAPVTREIRPDWAGWPHALILAATTLFNHPFFFPCGSQ